MDVQVGDALGDGVVDADEAAVRAGASCHGRADLLYPCEQRPGQLRRQVSQRQIVQAGDDQRVTFEHRAGVEECHGVLVGGHDGLIGFLLRRSRRKRSCLRRQDNVTGQRSPPAAHAVMGEPPDQRRRT
jgi:hypothetical protein